MCRKPEQPRRKPEHIDPEPVKPRLKPEHSDPEPEHTRPKPEHHSCGLKMHIFPMFFASLMDLNTRIRNLNTCVGNLNSPV